MTTTININSKNKPSRALIMRTLAVYIEQGHKDMELIWGENWIEIVKGGTNWYGSGWIKEIGGDDIAKELNEIQREAERRFMKDHFTIVVIK